MDDNQKWNHELEQAIAGGKVVAGMWSAMYHQLINDKVPESQAAHIVAQYAHGFGRKTENAQ